MELPQVSFILVLVLRCSTEPHPNVWQLELAHISIEGWIISPDVNGFFDCSEEVLVFPCQYTEIFNRYCVTRDANMVMYWWRGL